MKPPVEVTSAKVLDDIERPLTILYFLFYVSQLNFCTTKVADCLLLFKRFGE